MQVNLLAAFFFFTYFGCFAPEGFFGWVAVTAFRHSASPRRIPPETYASKLARRFFLFYISRLLRTRGIFWVGCRHFVPALGFASSNPAGCTILLKIITPVEYVSCNWCFFFLLAKKLSKK